jgi:UDP-N-acetylglucosamine:LPS N-acetylglucosamine transferase
MPRLLILSSDTGEGHNSAAAAISERATARDWNVSIRKPPEEATAVYRTLNGVYNFLLTHRPGMVGILAAVLDRCRPNEADWLYRHVGNFIERMLGSEEPDVVLSVHPMLNHMIQRTVKEKGLRTGCATFVTDPYPPFWRAWSSPFIDRYFVLTPEAGAELERQGIPAARIERVPMPLRGGFRRYEPAEIEAFRSRLGIGGAMIVVNGGARGGGPVARIAQTVLHTLSDVDVIVLCGTNARLRDDLSQKAHSRLHPMGFVDDIHSVIASADLVITKPGALSVYETLAAQVPAVLSAIGGLMPQESGMFRAVGDHGFGFAVRTLDELARVLEKGADGWRAKQDAIAGFYAPDSTPHLVERIELSRAG